MKSIFDTLLFDLDDTLIVEWGSAEESFLETIDQLDFQIDKIEFLEVIRKQARENWYKLPTINFCRNIGISSWEALWADFTGDDEQYTKLRELSSGYRFDTWYQALTRFNISDAIIAERLSSEFKRIRKSKHILFPETIETLKKLKNEFKLGLITNGAPDLQWKKINGGNLKHYFDYIAISGELGFAKPDKKLFDIVIKELGSIPECTIMIGDSLSTDIKGGKDSGLRTIWINRTGNKTDEIKPDYEVTNLLEILKIITAPPNSLSN
jgi:putative hydrolase of the HAD superfamily